MRVDGNEGRRWRGREREREEREREREGEGERRDGKRSTLHHIIAIKS